MHVEFQPDNPERFRTAIQRFDEANAQDPHQEIVDGLSRPRELIYAERLTRWLLRLKSDASEVLRLAARCQHIRRWEIPRQSYPMTREGYLGWREALKHRHAEIAGVILREAGYSQDTIERVQSLNLKRNLRYDPECQTLEDALCLVFLEFQFSDLAGRLPDDKVIPTLKKSWAKMSQQGREAAMSLKFGKREQELLEAALR